MPSSIGGTPRARAISRSRLSRQALGRDDSDVLGLDEVHVLRCEAHGLPVEAAFEQHRSAGVGGALEALLQLGLEALELLR
jgi:hypothetical protein